MKVLTYLLTYLLLGVALTLSACSQRTVDTPADAPVTTPLTPLAFGTGANDHADAVAVSPRYEAIFVAGSTSGSLDGRSRGGQDVVLRRYRRDGTLVWKRQFGTARDDVINALDVDKDGNLYLAGETQDAADPHGEVNPGFLKKYSRQGVHLWTRIIPYAPDPYVSIKRSPALDVAVDGGNVYVVGGRDLFGYVSKYTSGGQLLWSHPYDGWGVSHRAYAVDTDAQGNVYVGGSTTDDWGYGGVVSKYSRDGQLLWSSVTTSIPGVVTDLQVSGNSFFVTGKRMWEVCRDDPGNVPICEYPSDVLVHKYDLGGKQLWGKTFGTSAEDAGAGITVDGRGNVYVAGQTYGSLTLANRGGSDMVVRRYNADGRVAWTRQIGSSGYDSAADIAAYSSGELYLVGTAGGKLGSDHHGGTDGLVRRLDARDGKAVWTDQ